MIRCDRPVEKPFWDRFCTLIGREDLRPRAFDPSAVGVVRAEFSARSGAALRALFDGETICVTELTPFDEAMEAEHAGAIGLTVPPGAAPGLGEHTRSTLSTLGLTDAELRALRGNGVTFEG